jgi:hypothetical protein
MSKILEMELQGLLGWSLEHKRAGSLLRWAIHLKNLASFLRPSLNPLILLIMMVDEICSE